MATASALVECARAEIGYTEHPAGSNLTKFGAWYGLDGEPWCDMFVSWCAAQVGAGEEVGRFAYCPYHVAFFRSRGQWHPAGEDGFEPQPGDIVFFARKLVACHVGIVAGMTADGGAVVTIEGNTSVSDDDNGGAVMLRTRTYGNPGGSWGILGFGRPAYDSGEVEALTDEDLDRIFGYEIDGVSVANRLRRLSHETAVETLGYTNEAMNGDADVYQLITDTRRLGGWDYQNARLESVDAYQILRDVRDAVEELREILQELNDKVL